MKGVVSKGNKPPISSNLSEISRNFEHLLIYFADIVSGELNRVVINDPVGAFFTEQNDVNIIYAILALAILAAVFFIAFRLFRKY